MKKTLLSIIFFPLLLAGCVNLDILPSDSLTSSALASNPAAAVYTTDGVYSMMKDMLEFRGGISQNNTFVRQYFVLNEVKSDNFCFSWTSTDPFWTSAQYMDDANSADAAYMWVACYKMIFATNANISGLVETETPSEQNQLKGENLFLRAFFHLMLCNLFAKPYAAGPDNPGIVIRRGTDYSETKRATVGEVYAGIEEDLKAAIKLMDPTTRRYKGDNGYASKEAAQALLGRVYLYEGKWQDCVDICSEILGDDPASHLETEVKDLYAKSSTSKEVLWCVDMTDADIAGWSTKGLVASMFDSPDGTQGKGWGELYVADPLLDLLTRFPGDKRFTDLVRLHNAQDGLFITWGVEDDINECLTNVNIYPTVTDIDNKTIVSSITDNNDGTYSFTYDGQAMKAIPDNTATKISDEFPGYILDDAAHTRCYVRNKMPSPVISEGNVIWEINMGSVRPGGYPTWFCNKLSYREGSAYDLNASYIMVRYGEVVLNRAEAYAHLGGNDDKALADVNVIRQRAGLSGTALMTTANMAGRGYPTAVDAVLDERKMELFLEGFRVVDLVRNGKDIDRRFPSRTKCEVISHTDPRIQYQIPVDETAVSGIPINDRN